MIPIVRPVLGSAEARAAVRVLRSGWLTQGPEVAAFESEFASRVGAEHACAVANCTVALHLAFLAVGLSPGDEAILPTHTYVACANAVRQCGAVPVFVDVEEGAFNMDPAAVAAAITPRTRAILCVHQIGMPCDLGAILPIARAYGLPVIEDAACAIGSQIEVDGRWEEIGKPHGDIACFSFHPRKVLTVGDGGMLTTANPAWDRMFRLWRQHGMDVSDTVRHASDRPIFETYSVVGYNYRLTDIQAAIGREQLRRLSSIVATRRALASRYRVLLRDVDVTCPSEPRWARSNWQSYCVRLPRDVSQVEIMTAMLAGGVTTRRGIMCVHLEEAYADAELRHPLASSERARDECILLPLFPGMSERQQRRVAVTLETAIAKARAHLLGGVQPRPAPSQSQRFAGATI